MGPARRVVVAGDGTVLLVDDELLDPIDPPAGGAAADAAFLIEVAMRHLVDSIAGSPSSPCPDGCLVKPFVAETGDTLAVEVLRDAAAADGLMVTQLNPWCYPSDLGKVTGGPAAAAALMAGGPASLLLPGLPAFREGVAELFSKHRVFRDLKVFRHPTSEIRTTRFYGWIPAAGTPPVGVALDITDLLPGPAPETRFYDTVMSVIPDSLLVISVDTGDVAWSNGRAASRLGYQPDKIANYADLRSLLHPADRPDLDEVAERIEHNPATPAEQLRFRVQDARGTWRWTHLWITPWLSDADGRVTEVLCTIRDVDEAVRAERRMAWEAGHDPLTGLVNRRVIADTLAAVADDPDDIRRQVYFIDLDDFKKINDAYGHAAGDDLLCTLAARISMLVAAPDVIGRFGGDELIIVSTMPAEQLGNDLLVAIRRPVQLGGTELSVTTSIGVARVGAAEEPGDVVRRANEAMYAAKRGGGNRYVIAGPLNTGPAQRRVEVESELRRALADHAAGEDSQLQMAFQPIVTADRVPIGAEALLRWEHPSRGRLLPSEFLDIAEAAGLMSQLSELIVRQSIRAAATWAAAGRPLLVTVNAGRRELGSGRLTSLVTESLVETGTRPEQLCIEVTESVLVDAGSPELAELWRLRDMGVEIALDDFGTGYAPLTYLKRIPATVLKLDKSFVTGLGLPVPHATDLAVSRMVAQLGTELGLKVVAEGVESVGQMQTLTSIGYSYFQGFWAHAPMPAEELVALLTAPERLPSAGHS